MKKLLVVLAAIVLVGLGIVLFMQSADTDKSEDTANTSGSPSQSNSNSTNNTDNASDNPDQSVDSTTLTYTSSGFTPKSVTVKAGSKLTVVNNSGAELDFASNEHPTHEDNSELNMGEVANGASRTITLNDKGSWGVHNHDNDAHEATVVVE